MSKGTKPFKPQTYEDLLSLWYGSGHDGKDVDLYNKQRYLDYYQSEFVSKWQEEQVVAFFSKVGRVDKIPEKADVKTYDLKVDEVSLLIEVTSIVSEIKYERVEPLSNDEFLDMVNDTVNHIFEKDSREYHDYVKGGVVYYDGVLNMRTFPNFYDKLLEMIPEQSEITEKEWDYLIFIHEVGSTNGKSTLELYPVMLFVKRAEISPVLETVFSDVNYRLIEL